MSREGVAFSSTAKLRPPVGSHVELSIDWPTEQEFSRTIDLPATGFVVWTGNGEIAVRITSHRFRVHELVLTPQGA